MIDVGFQVDSKNAPYELFGAAIDLGAQSRGCSEAPRAIEKLLNQRGIPWNIQQDFQFPQSIDPRDTVKSIGEFCNALSSKIRSTVHKKRRFAVIGGDHSVAIGTWSGAALALRARGNMGLIWIDAHMDSHTLETSPSGAIHGMPLAALLGIGSRSFTEIGDKSAKILPQNLCLIGVRSYEQAEFDLLKKLGVKVFFMADVHEQGFSAVFEKALAIAKSNTMGFGITIDVDAIDPTLAPGVGSPVANGLKHKPLIQCLKDVSCDGDWLGLEIAELNPLLDENSATANLVIELLLAGC